MAVFRRRQFSGEKGICHVSEDTIIKVPDPSGLSCDPFTAVLRDGARKLIEQAIHAELATLMAGFAGEKLKDGRARLVRHGYLPEREVMTGIGPVAVTVPRLRDRGTGEDKISFTPSILPRYLRKAKSVEELLPWLYLKGVSTGDFTGALAALLGPNAKGLSPTTITRLKADWWHVSEEKHCVLVIVGADEYGRKELLAMTDGFRESTQSWREVLLDFRRLGLTQDPKLAIGDGALGFWTALREVFAPTREQRCWVHKAMNVLNALPQSVQAKAKGHLHDIWQAETRAKAEAAFDFFVETYGVTWDKAVDKLVKDRSALLTFYDYPAEHWKHIRTSNPIESTFATLRHRTKRTKGCLSRQTGLAMAFRLMIAAQGKWRKLDGQNRLPEIIQGVEFRVGLRQLQVAA